MKVKDLINQLREFDPQSKVRFRAEVESGYASFSSTGQEKDCTLSFNEETNVVELLVSGEEEDSY
jgi:hypothetical protein